MKNRIEEDLYYTNDVTLAVLAVFASLAISGDTRGLASGDTKSKVFMSYIPSSSANPAFCQFSKEFFLGGEAVDNVGDIEMERNPACLLGPIDGDCALTEDSVLVSSSPSPGTANAVLKGVAFFFASKSVLKTGLPSISATLVDRLTSNNGCLSTPPACRGVVGGVVVEDEVSVTMLRTLRRRLGRVREVSAVSFEDAERSPLPGVPKRWMGHETEMGLSASRMGLAFL